MLLGDNEFVRKVIDARHQQKQQHGGVSRKSYPRAGSLRCFEDGSRS